MRFKFLPESFQIAVAEALTKFIDNEPADLDYPAADAGVWWGALLHFNVKLDATSLQDILHSLRLRPSVAGLLSIEDFEQVVEAVEYVVHGPAPEHGTCDCCGSVY